MLDSLVLVQEHDIKTIRKTNKFHNLAFAQCAMSPIKQLLSRLMFLIQKNTNVAIVFSLLIVFCTIVFIALK